MRPVHFLFLTAVLAAGLTGSVLLIPGQADLGLIYLKERRYTPARAVFEKLLASGKPSADVVVPLAEIYVQSGEVDRAVDLLGRYSGRPSDRLALLDRLGKFQMYGQRKEDYLRTLEIRNSIRLSEDGLRELANLYRYTSQDAGLIQALQALTARFPDNPSDFLELANLLAAGGRIDEAARVVVEFEKRFPQAISADTVELLANLLLDSGHAASALERARQWLAVHDDPNAVVRFAELLRTKAQPGLAGRLLIPFDGMLDRTPVLLAEWTELEVASGNSLAAFERLDGLYRKRLLSPELTEPYLDLALTRGRLALAIEVAEQRGLHNLPGRVLGNLAERAIAEGKLSFAQRMVTALGAGFLSGRPVVAARLAYARGDRAEAFAQLARVDLTTQPAPVLLDVARMYLNAGRARDAVGRFEGFRATSAPAGAAQAWALLAAASRRGPEVALWLDAQTARAISPDLLKDLFYLAQDNKQPELALSAARRMFLEAPGDANRLLLANALVAANQPAEALPHFRHLVAQPGHDLDDAYTAALLGAIRTSPQAAPSIQRELRDFWTARLRQPTLDQQRRLDIVYGLLELGEWGAALPQLAALARQRDEIAPLYIETAVKAGHRQDAVTFLKSQLEGNGLTPEVRQAHVWALIEQGGLAEALPYVRQLAAGIPTWIPVYEDALRKLGRTAELSDFLRHRGARDDLPPDEQRTTAFQLIDAGDSVSARAIFGRLARHAPPDHPDVTELLFLWSPKPPPEVLEWLEARASQAAGPERVAWLSHLLDAGASAPVVRLAALLPPPGQGGALLDVYLRALAARGEAGALAAAVGREVPALNDAERVRALAHLARDSGEAAAAPAYARLLELTPGDREARHWLGVYAFSRGRYSSAEEYLGRLLRSSGGAWDDNFCYAEMLWRKGDRNGAKIYYESSIRMIAGLTAPILPAQIARAQALLRTGRGEQSRREFRTLLVQNPGDDNLRADYAASLLEGNHYEEAEAVLAAAANPASSRIELLRAQLLAATGRKGNALAMLRGIAGPDPNAARAQTALGEIESGMGRSRLARDLFETAVRMEPGSEDLDEARNNFERDRAPQIRTGYESRSIQGAQSENLVHLLGERALSAFRMQFELDQDWASVGAVRYADGHIAPFQGTLRRGRISIGREWREGTRLEVSAFGGGPEPGTGVAVIHPDTAGVTAVEVQLNRPYWDFAETLAESGVRDRAEVRRELSLGRRLSARFGGAWNRYDLKNVPRAAESASAVAGVDYHLAGKPQLTLEYTFDAEYALSVVSRTTPGGASFEPLPLHSREVHSAGIALDQPVTRDLRVSGAAGIAVDRLGGWAPFSTIHVTYEPRHRFGARFDFDRRLYYLDSARSMTTFGGGIFWRF